MEPVPYHHVVLFQLRQDTSEDEVATALEALRSLGSLPGIASWRIERSLDERKGIVLVEVATFESEAAFDAFRSSPEHQAVVERMASISDWLIGDFLGSR